METEGSLPHSQVPATCPYPASAPSSQYPPHLIYAWDFETLKTVIPLPGFV